MKKVSQTQEGFFKAKDQTELFYYSLRAKEPKGTLVVVHGLDEHSGRYRHFAEYLTGQGWQIYLYDQRGHGRSKGLRGYAEGMQQLAEDLHVFVEWVKKQEKTDKVFVLGHSFGGQVTINYLADYAPELRGAVLSAPNVQLALPVSPLKKSVGRFLSNFLPTLRIANDVKPEYVSRDPEVVRDYCNDPFLQQKISLRLGAAILDNLDEIIDLATKIKLPCLVLHGSEDKITAKEGSETFFKKLSSKDKKLKIYSKFYHEILNEPEKLEVYQDICHWLQERLS